MSSLGVRCRGLKALFPAVPSPPSSEGGRPAPEHMRYPPPCISRGSTRQGRASGGQPFYLSVARKTLARRGDTGEVGVLEVVLNFTFSRGRLEAVDFPKLMRVRNELRVYPAGRAAVSQPDGKRRSARPQPPAVEGVGCEGCPRRSSSEARSGLDVDYLLRRREC